jgi:copper chaperone CopZ
MAREPRRTEKAFSKQPGVEHTNVNLADGVLIVTVKPVTRFDDAQLKQVVHAAGFVLKAVVSRPTGATE